MPISCPPRLCDEPYYYVSSDRAVLFALVQLPPKTLTVETQEEARIG